MQNNIMLDLETMSTAHNAAIVSIGAVRFDENGLLEEFYCIVDLGTCEDAGLHISSDTVLWWLKQSSEARSIFQKYQEVVPLDSALVEFSTWVGRNPLIWGNGASFDNVVLRNAYVAECLPVPWSFRDDRCYQTIKTLNPGIKLARVGTHHNALDDAKSQALHLINIWETTRPF